MTRFVVTRASERRFGIFVDRRVVSACVLYSLRGIGQVESVTTASKYRNRGYGRAIVEAAAGASVERGDQLTFTDSASHRPASAEARCRRRAS